MPVALSSYDLDKHHMQFVLNFPRVQTIGKYETDGRVLLLTIRGNGNINITDGENTPLLLISSVHSLALLTAHIPGSSFREFRPNYII
jgi:hypothetical protein